MFNKNKKRRAGLVAKLRAKRAEKRAEADRAAKMKADAEQHAKRQALGNGAADAEGWDLQTDLGGLVMVTGDLAPHKDTMGRVVALQLAGQHPTADVDLLNAARDVMGQEVYYLHELQRIRPAEIAPAPVALLEAPAVAQQ